MSTSSQYVELLKAQVGKRYCNEGPWRCTGEFGCWDCSGFCCWGLNQLGIRYPCSNTDIMAFDLHRKGLLVSAGYARATPGTWCIRLHDSHHMACSIGGGLVVEAASHALGVRIGNFDGRGWDVFGKPPGLTFGGHLPTPDDGDDMPLNAHDIELIRQIVKQEMEAVVGGASLSPPDAHATVVDVVKKYAKQ